MTAKHKEMAAIKWNIPGIRDIYAVEAAALPGNLQQTAAAGLPIATLAIIGERFEFHGEATCEITETHTRAGTSWKSTLKFVSSATPPSGAPRAWIVRDNNGRITLLGQREDPAPRLSAMAETATFGSRAAISYEITAVTPPIEIGTLLITT